MSRRDECAESPGGWLDRAKRMSFTALRVYLLLLLLMLLLENKLIFPARKYPAGDWQPFGVDFEDVAFTSADGTSLHGWYLEHPAPKGYLLYCHGNGENIADISVLVDDLRGRADVSVFAFDYRGYGRSEGSPNERGVLADGEAAQAWLSERAGVERGELILAGRSLGGAVAVHLASHTQAKALILDSTFTSMPDVAATIHWWAPVRWLMRTQFNSAEKIKRYQGPLLQFHGTADQIVPLPIAEQLFRTAPMQDKTFVEIDGATHNSWSPEDYLAGVRDLVNRVTAE